METNIELQFHDFAASKSAFTFVPYGLDTKLAREAVKVHVLHGRKRNLKPIQSQPDQVEGQSFWWDSRATVAEVHRPCRTVRLKGHLASHDTRAGRQKVVGGGRPSITRHNPHFLDDRLSMDDRVLHNPFVQRLRDESGHVGRYHVEAANFLVDHYLSRCGPSRFPRELLACYWHDSATFKAFLAHAATLYSLETGLSPPVRVEALMCIALGEIRTRLADSTQDHIDGTTLAITILANVEEGRTQRETAAWHWRGLKQLLKIRGGLTKLRLHRDLHTMLLWREILTSNSTDLCFGHDTDDFSEIQFCSEHIVSFFDNFACQLADEAYLAKKEDKVQQFLAEIVNRNIVRYCEWTCSMRRRSEIACLVYLAMLAISARRSSDSRRMMERVKNEVIERDEWGTVSQEELLFVILRHGSLENDFRCQQLWQISRCIFVTRKLDNKDWKTVRDILSLYLGIQEGCDSRTDVLEAWEGLSKRLLLEDGCHVELGQPHATGLEGVPS